MNINKILSSIKPHQSNKIAEYTKQLEDCTSMMNIAVPRLKEIAEESKDFNLFVLFGVRTVKDAFFRDVQDVIKGRSLRRNQINSPVRKPK